MESFDGLTESKFEDDMSQLDTNKDENKPENFEISSFEGISSYDENTKVSERITGSSSSMVGGISEESLKIEPMAGDYQFDDNQGCDWSFGISPNVNTTRTHEEGSGYTLGTEDEETLKGTSDSPDLANLTPDPEKIWPDFKNSTPDEERSENESESEMKKLIVSEYSGSEISKSKPESGIEDLSSENEEKKLTISNQEDEQESYGNVEVEEESEVSSSNGSWINEDEEILDDEEISNYQDAQSLATYNDSNIENKEFNVVEVTERTSPASQIGDSNGSKTKTQPEVTVSSPAVTYHSPENEFSSPVDEDYEKTSSFNSYQYNAFDPELEIVDPKPDVLQPDADMDDDMKSAKNGPLNRNIVCYKRENSISVISSNNSCKHMDKDCKCNGKKGDKWEESEVNSSTTIEIEEGEVDTKLTRGRKAIQKFNKFFSAIKWALIRSSLILLLFFWLISMIYGSLSLSSNDWLVNTVAYKCGEISGHSYTFLGPYGLSRKDIAYLKDGAKLTLTRGLVYYNEIINKGYKDPEGDTSCPEDGDDKPKPTTSTPAHGGKKLEDDACELPADLTLTRDGDHVLSSDEEKARKIITSTNEKINIYSQCGHERKFIRKSCCFRDMCAVGNLNESDTSYFKSLYGPTVYDIHYSEFENFDKGGKTLWYTGIVSMVFLFLAIIMVSERIMTNKVELTIRLAMRNMANILWIISVFLSVTAFFLWRYFSGGSVCVDELGKSRPCQYYYATYFYIVHILSSLLGLVSYAANCIAGSRRINEIHRI
ncbi:putative integral membrane protein [Theileria parva strain Muguga]|uniref:Uncharacterized protein n=1 Tax=Theileria parva TaxID=5875 RepID=Q4N0I3_THEPA|nr:putative integral membrane protein [Theileria parva strain Muguga]EAN30888.1 putative integral membrane protein [Theileria parva strain Muguga]|eukprot:XP_763171.1 hypothetical protein [Theileria parva strain Muguga]